MNKYQIMQKLLIKYSMTLLGLIIFSVYFWNRFIRERLPKDIYITLFSFRYYITFILLFVFIIMIIISLKNIFSINNGSILNKVLSNKYFHYIYNNIIIPIKEGPEQLYELFYDSIKISFIIEPIHRFFFNYNIYNYAKYIVLFLKIWRIVVLFSFILDVFYFQQFYYLYKTLYKIPQVDQENIRYILRQIDFNYLINTENLTLKDIQVYVELLFDNYYLLNNFITEYINNIINEIQKVENESVPNELEMIIQKLLTNIAFCIFIQTLYSKL